MITPLSTLNRNEREAARHALEVLRWMVELTRQPPAPAQLVDLHVRALNALSLGVAVGLTPASSKTPLDELECGDKPTVEQLDLLVESAQSCAHRLRAAAELVYARLHTVAPHLIEELSEALELNRKEGL